MYGRRRRRIRAAAVVAACVLASGPVAMAADYPSESDIERARQDEVAARGAVAGIEADLTALTQRLDDLAIEAGRAVEAYNGARVALADAEDAERAADRRAQLASAAAEQSREQLGRVAAATYRAGGQFSALELVLQAADSEHFLRGTDALVTVTRSFNATYDDAIAATAEADLAAAEAEHARTMREDAVAAAEQAAAVAAGKVSEQEAAVAAAERQRDTLLAELAAARGTTLALEQRRQDALAAQAAAEREKAEREQADEREADEPTTLAAGATEGSDEPDASAERSAGDQASRGDRPEQVGGSGSTSSPDQAAGPSSATPGPAASTTSAASAAPPPTATPAPSPRPSVTPSPSASPAPSPSATSTPSATPSPSPPPAALGGVDKVIAYAHAQVGKPYRWGGAGPDAFDCSGLTMRAWQQAGKNLPHWSVAQARATTRVSYSQLRPGDLIFWSDNGQASGTYHVGLYIGNGQMIHAPREGRPVEVQNVFYWRTPSFYGRV